MGLVWEQSLNTMIARVKDIPSNLVEESIQLVEEAVEEGASIMENNIDRIDTGLMKGSVSSSKPAVEGTTVFAEFGWGVGGTEVRDYFKYQEYGFRHAGSGKDIPPMHALTGAFLEVWERFKGRLSRAVR